ncbi:MAG TPA: cache domain-containing protein, partial [Nitrospiraceae bacterium]
MNSAMLTVRLTVALGTVCALVAAGCSPQASSDRKQEIVTLVEEAAALVSSEGDAAFAKLQDPNGKWRKGDDYVFISNMDGTILFHPVSPEMVGKNHLELRDDNGKAFLREMLEVVKKSESGWVEYMWPKPG